MLQFSIMKTLKFSFDSCLFTMLFFLISFCSATESQATVWNEIHTPHFRLVFDAKHKEIAEIYAVRAERAYEILLPIFKEAPATTVIHITDSTDLANGSATRVPFPLINVYPVLPGPLETIGEYGDWAQELLIHEYTHILSFEPAHGPVYETLRPVFGTVIAPNMLMPRWWLEGVAVETETRFSNSGRLRSYYQEAALRAMVIENKLDSHSIDQMNETGIPSWPYGARPYLFGSLMWSEMVEKKSGAIENLHQTQSRKMIYFINSPVEDLLGVNYVTVFEEIKTSLRHHVSTQMKSFKNIQTPQAVTLKGVETHLPVISPDGLKMIFISKSEVGQRSIEFVQRENTSQVFHLDEKAASIWIKALPEEEGKSLPQAQQDGPPGGNISRVSWFPDSNRIVFDKAQLLDRKSITSDLFLYDFTTQKSQRLSTGARMKEPAVSPSGDKLVFVQIEAGRTSLGTCNVDGSGKEMVFQPALQWRSSFPSFINSDEVLFSLRDDKGNEHLHVFNLKTKNLRKVLSDYPTARFAHVRKNQVIFSSARSGLLEVYLTDTTFKNVRPVARVATGLFASDLDTARNEIYMTMMTSEGLQIKRTPLLMAGVGSMQVPGLYEDRYPRQKQDGETPSSALGSFAAEKYSPWRDLLPHYWIPFLYSTENGVFVQAITSGQDAPAENFYTLQLGYDNHLHRGSFALSYLNRQTPTYMGASYIQRQQSLLAADYIIEEQIASATADRELSWVGPEASWGIGGIWKSRTVDGGPRQYHVGPLVSLSYSDITQPEAQIAPEQGKAANLSFVNYESSANDYRQLNLGGTYYHSKWLPKRHSLGLKAQGLYTDGLITGSQGSSSSGAPIASDLVIGDFLMRGFMSGQFLGKNIINTNLEYRFPIRSYYRGFGTNPLFIKRLSGNIFFDQLWMKGFYYDSDLETYVRSHNMQSFSSAGFEAKLETTIGYQFPLSLLVGIYKPLTNPNKNETNVFMGFLL